MYLVGYIVGPLVFAPLSEHFGRRHILLLTSGLFTSMSIGCTLAPTFAWLLTFRFLAGAGGSAPISIIGGVYADIFPDPTIRGRATAAYTVVGRDHQPHGSDADRLQTAYNTWYGARAYHMWLYRIT